MQTLRGGSLLSPISPVSSPETVDVLQNAERLLKTAQRQLMEVSVNSTRKSLNENLPSYLGQQHLDDGLLYIRDIVEAKFEDTNERDTIYNQKTSTSNVHSSNRNLQLGRFPIRESNNILNNPLEISEQSSQFLLHQIPKQTLSTNERPFLQKAPHWFQKQIHVFPTSTTCNVKSNIKSSPAASCCAVANSGVFAVNSKNPSNKSIKVQTGPTLEIRGGLTIQNIENIHISPDPSTVAVHNNIAMYCFQHEPLASSSISDSNKNQLSKSSITAFNGEKNCDVEGERHIQSTNYKDEQKVQQIENTDHNVQYNTVATHVMPANTNNNNDDKNNHSVNYDKNDTNIVKNKVFIDSSVKHHPILHKTLMDSQKLHELKMSLGSPEDARNSQLKKTVSIISDPIEPALESVFPTDLEVQAENEREEIDKRDLSQNHQEFSTNLDLAGSYHNQKFLHAQSDKYYVQRSKACKDECRTGSCSRKCERDVEHTEKQKLTEALQAIVNIQKLRYDMKDTGVVPTQCTQMCNDRNECVADTRHLDFQPISEPDQFKRLLEQLCKFSPNTGASEIDTNSKIFQEAMNDFVEIFFEISGNLRSPVSNVGDKDTVSIQNGQAIKTKDRADKIKIVTNAEKAAKDSKQANLFPELNQMEYRRGSEVKPKMGENGIDRLLGNQKNAPTSQAWRSSTGRAREPNKYPKRVNTQSPKQKVAQQEKSHSKTNYQEQQNNLVNLNLQQPCVSEVDAFLKNYQESMAAICQGTEQLSQLILHHVMKNASSTPDQILSLPVPGNEKNFVPCSSTKSPGQSPVKSCTNRMQVTEVLPRKYGVIRTPSSESFPVRSRNDVELSNDVNSVCIDEGCTTVTDIDDTSNATTMPQVDEPNSANMNPKSAMAQQRVAKPARKPGGTQFMDIHYCMTEPPGVPISIGVKSDNNNSPSNLKSSMSMHLQFENASGENTRLCQRSSPNVYSDQTVDLDFYESQVFTSGCKYNFNSSNNHPSEEVTAEPVLENKKVEFQELGKFFDAMKKSSHLLKQSGVLLANGIEIDSVDDFLRSLEVAAIHPIVIEKFLSTLGEKSRENFLLGRNLVMSHQMPLIDLHNGDEHSATLHPAGDHINNKMNSKDPLMNLNLKFSDDCTYLINHTNSQGDEVPKNNSKSDSVAPDKDIGKIYLENSHNNFNISKPAFQDKIGLSTSSLLSPLGNHLVHSSKNEEGVPEAQRISSSDDNRVRKESSESENHRHDNTALNEQSNANMGLQNSSSSHTINEKNYGDTNTDKDFNFSIPIDADMNDDVPEIPMTNEAINDASKSQQQEDQASKHSTLEKTNLIESPDNSNRTLECEDGNSIEQDSSKIEVNDVLFQSSLDTGKTIVDPQLQDNNEPSRRKHLEEGAVHYNFDKTQIPPSRTILNSGESSSKSNSTSKNHGKKSANTSSASEKKKKPYHRHDTNQNSTKVVAGAANRDFEKSSPRNMCPLCIRFHGTCSCLNCSNCMANFRKYEEVSPKIKVTKAKLPKSTAVTSRQVGSVKRLAQNSNGKSLNSRQGMPKMIKNSINPLAQKNASPIRQKFKSKRNSAMLSNGTFDSIELLKSEDGPENCQKFSQGTTPDLECSIMQDESQNTKSCVGKTVSTNTETMWQEATILANTSQLLIGTLEKIVIMNKFDNPAKETQVLKCSEESSMIKETPDNYKDCQNQKTSTTNIKKFTSMECQTSQSSSGLQKEYKYSLETIPEVKMDSISTEKSLEMFENQSILVLHPLNEVNHTYFIAKPNFEERKLIKKKLHANFNISNKEVTEYDQSCNKSSKKLTSSDDPSHLNVSLPADNRIDNKECQVICSDVEDMVNLTDKKQSTVIFAPQLSTVSNPSSRKDCHDSCSNDDECLMCLQSSSESDNSQFPCSQDCLDKETCSKVCAAITDFDQTLQSGSINISGILRNFLTENNTSSVKLPTLKALIQELEKVTYSQSVDRDQLEMLHEKSEHDTNQNDTELTNAVDSVQAAKPRFNEDETRASSVQYGEPHEKLLLIMKNRRSLIMPNVVRGLADVHPSKNLERLILHSTDPLVSGTFNKPESETRYSVFNKSDSERTSFCMKDSKIQEHSTSVAQASIQQIDMKPLEISADDVQSVAIKKAKKSPMAEKSMNSVSKSKKNGHGMQTDSSASASSHKYDESSQKTFDKSHFESEVAQGTKDDTGNQKIENLQTYWDKGLNDPECSSRPQIINHFLGKMKLEDMKIQNTNNNKTDCTNFTPITTIDSEKIGIGKSLDRSMTQVNMQNYFASKMPEIPRTDLTKFNRSASKYWDQTSSDTLSEGEINLPSSCSRSLGEVRITTSSCSTTVGRSFRDPDGFTVIITKSVLDSTQATCTSPGEILAEINGAETDSSSSIPENITLTFPTQQKHIY